MKKLSLSPMPRRKKLKKKKKKTSVNEMIVVIAYEVK